MGKRLLRLYDIVTSRIENREKELLDENETLQIRRLGDKMDTLKGFCNFFDTFVEQNDIDTMTVWVDKKTNRIKFQFNCFVIIEHQDEKELRYLFSMLDALCITPQEDGSMECVFEFPTVWDFSLGDENEQ